MAGLGSELLFIAVESNAATHSLTLLVFKLIDIHHQIRQMFMFLHHLHQHTVKASIHINLHPSTEVGKTQLVRGLKKSPKAKEFF